MKHRLTRAWAGLICLALLLAPVPALALRGGDTSYILDIPTELTVSGSGWNGTNGIDA